jgi:hypothetical protein
MSLFPGTPGLESRNCPETVPVPGLWELITPDCKVWSRRGLNQTCSPRRDLSNDALHSQFGGRKEVDSRLLVVGSQTASLTLGPSFAHNLSYRCSNDQCEAIFYIYASRTFQWHQWHQELQILTFSKCWASPPHLAKVGLRHISSHFPTLPKAWNVTPRLPSWLAPLQALTLVTSPRLGLQQITYLKICYNNFEKKMWIVIM